MLHTSYLSKNNFQLNDEHILFNNNLKTLNRRLKNSLIEKIKIAGNTVKVILLCQRQLKHI